MSTPLCIYIAGPLTGGDRMRNIQDAIDAGISCMRRGHHPFIPHLSHYTDDRARDCDIVFPYERWLEVDLAWVERADALLYLAPSPGADLELAYARELEKVVFTSFDQVPDLRPVPYDGSTLRSEILYYGRRTIVECDRKCLYAWGENLRPRVLLDSSDPEDWAWISDGIAGVAPRGLGYYEGFGGRPTLPDRHTRWCALECERSVVRPFGADRVEPPDFSRPVYNLRDRRDAEAGGSQA